MVSLIAGVVLVAMAVYILVMIYLTPGLNYLGLPLVPIVIFIVMAGAALYVSFSVPSTALKLWSAGKFRDSDKHLRGMLYVACLGGVVPGIFVYRAISCLDPVLERTTPPSPQLSTRPCPRCQAPMDAGDRFCKVCGASNPATQQA